MLICCVDGLKGFPEAIEAVFPQAWVQTCIVYLIRQSLPWTSSGYLPRNAELALKVARQDDGRGHGRGALDRLSATW